MQDGWSRLGPLPPLEVVEAVAGLGRNLTAFVALDVRIGSGDRGWNLVWPSTNAAAGDAAISVLNRRFGVQPVGISKDLIGDTTVLEPFGRAVLGLLLEPPWSERSELSHEAGHSVVVARGIDRRAAIDVLGTVNTHATTLRACLFSNVSDPVALLHARDDAQRGSTLAILQASRIDLTSAPVLLPYKSGSGLVVFLPRRPLRDLVDYATALFLDAPSLFLPRTAASGATSAEPLAFLPPVAGGRLLFALEAAQSSRPGATLYDLRDRQFVGATSLLEPAERPRIDVRQADAPAEAVRVLRARLKGGEAGFGSKLRLSNRSEDYGPRDLDTVRHEIRRLRRQERRLAAEVAPRLRLLRCPDASIRSLVDALRIVHAAGTEDETSLMYCCERIPSDGGLRHHILFMDSADVLDLWDTALAPVKGAEWFWSDPIWSKHYLPPGRSRLDTMRYKVFTPFGYGLDPFPHSWDRAEFEDFLARHLAVWADPTNKRAPAAMSAPLPPAVLIFEADGGGLQTKLTNLNVRVLPDQGFRPLSPECISWLNDVHLAYAALAPVEDATVSGVVAALNDRELASRITAESRQAVATAADLVTQAEAEVQQQSTDILDRLAKHVMHLLAVAEGQRTAIEERERLAAVLSGHYTSVAAAVDRIKAAHERIAAAAPAARREHDENAQKALAEISNIAGRVSADSAVIEGKLGEVEARIAALRKRIKEIRLW